MRVAVVGGVNILSVGSDDLIEGVRNVAGRDIEHAEIFIKRFHALLVDEEGEIRLMVHRASLSCVHLVAGVDVKIVAVLGHAYRACVKRHIGIDAVIGPAAEPVP